ncbi:Growth arrest-specific protein 7 [Sciurus carolinensis]|uniref:Growth arrest-specific protein 7 n=1 Tax=Sciurus carolinensis TaxID=30640 RepID=A0AA41N1W3_SCICA|nr:Growth arrest-specific protein 7 [Sciurus carolinensis]
MPEKQLLKPREWIYCDYFWADKKEPQGNGTGASKVEKPLRHFGENFKEDMKKRDHHISDLHKQLTSCYTFMEKTQIALTEKQRDLELKTQQLEIKLSNKKEENMHSRSPHSRVEQSSQHSVRRDVRSSVNFALCEPGYQLEDAGPLWGLEQSLQRQVEAKHTRRQQNIQNPGEKPGHMTACTVDGTGESSAGHCPTSLLRTE